MFEEAARRVGRAERSIERLTINGSGSRQRIQEALAKGWWGTKQPFFPTPRSVLSIKAAGPETTRDDKCASLRHGEGLAAFVIACERSERASRHFARSLWRSGCKLATPDTAA
jgi:hypothetical protein